MAFFDIIATTAQLSVGYDASNYATFSVSSAGDLTITPTGGDVAIAGNVSVSGSITGTATFTGAVVVDTIRRGTSDGSDNAVLQLTGGGSLSATRGAYIQLYGNENAAIGEVRIVAGAVAGGIISFYTGTTSTLRGTITDAGVFNWAGQITLAGITTSTTVGAAGAASALPAAPTGYITVTVGATARKIPYYAA